MDKTTVDKIAAGEVVERPSSVVKELVENAIDAGATAITVEIKDGGISFIRITDNGSGIPRDQVALAFLRHATSKITSVEELTQISSLGFRGEALSSIAAVAQVELITKTARELTGTRYVIEGGAEKSIEEIGAPDGTTFLVHHIFYNTPARAKFLKTAATEGGYVSALVEHLALSHPDISFKYIMNNQTKLHTSGNHKIRELVYNIYGREIAKELIPIHAESPMLTVDGFLGRPVIARGNRNYENYYVNGRYVKSRLIAKAIEDGYGTAMMQHKYPFTLLYLEMNGENVDVNVHPTKMELRFSNQEEIYQFLSNAVHEALHQREQIPSVTLGKDAPAKPGFVKPERPAAEPFETKRIQMEKSSDAYQKPGDYSAQQRFGLYQTPEGTVSGIRETLPIYPKGMTPDMAKQADAQPLPEALEQAAPAEQTQKPPAAGNDLKKAPEKAPGKPSGGSEKTAPAEAPEQLELFGKQFLSEEARRSHRIIGQVFDTYWLVEYDDKLYIIDQHAAHEKVLYERVMHDFETKQITSQMISPPLIVTLQMQEAQLLEKYADVFASFGFEIESFGGKEYQIRAVPHNLYGIASEEIFLELLDSLGEIGTERRLRTVQEKLASMSCKAAVKGNNRLSRREAEALIDELLSLENPYNCPHGRPTIISMSKYEMEKKFKRIV